ncbi:hypothetical protein O181_009367 [Austropuccinia psidii MF-1]|uniref:Integrase catalytic domain-containing protein n=1 Tax=Austropuccinia psidii MF-1 TaxID=1389203 RepID=A0A9Q3BRM6_9BASI|nr:hypothetical protein [Austropuccinia psidii MF-1]
MYVCQNGKHNPKTTTHKESICCVEHPELRPPSNRGRKKYSKQDNDAKTHQTGVSALLTSKTLNMSKENSLVVNCGATHHMLNNKKLFASFVKMKDLKIATSDPTSSLISTGKGTLIANVESSITLHKENEEFKIPQENFLILEGQILNNLMVSDFTNYAALLTTMHSGASWHSRLGHPSNQTLKSMGLPIFDKEHCDVCARGKITFNRFNSHFDKVEKPLDCPHLDQVGAISPPSVSGYRYFLTIVDQHTSFKFTRFLKHKLHSLKEFITFKKLANESGFIHITSPPYTPQLNGFAEHPNRTILEKACCLLLGANIPNHYWAEAVNHATLLTNLIPTPSRENLSPFQLWTGTSPTIKSLRPFGCKFEKLDIKSAFLHVPLEENVLVAIPQGLDLDRKTLCLKLNKAIYGLRQAPQTWYNCLSNWLVMTGFKAAVLDPCIFYWKDYCPIWLFVHVDDIGIFGKDLERFKKEIKQEFKTKLLGQADLLVGIKIHHDDNFIRLSQEHYVESILDLYGMNDCRTVATPLIPNEHLEAATLNEVKEFEKLNLNYRSAISSLSYISMATRPDISYAVSALSQFLEKPGINHWKAFMHVLRYLRGTSNVSVSGHLIIFNKGMVIWKTKKQPTVLLPSAEAEYKSLCNLASKVLWFQQFCDEVKLPNNSQLIKIYEDNEGCIDTANSDCNANSQRMKHVEIQLHFFREVIKNSKISLVYTPTAAMLADFLTKSVCKPAIVRAMSGLNLMSLQRLIIVFLEEGIRWYFSAWLICSLRQLITVYFGYFSFPSIKAERFPVAKYFLF